MKATKNILMRGPLAYKHAPKTALGFFAVAAGLGTYMKAGLEFGFAFEYDHTLHAHSHLAFQGWVYLILFYLTTSTFLTQSSRNAKRVQLQYSLTVVVLVGIGWAFLYEGYGVISITLSTLFQVLNWLYAYTILSTRQQHTSQHSLASLALYSSVGVGLFSTLFPFAIGAVAAKGMAGSELYQSLIYTFLHLQYNGWFLLAALSVVLLHYEQFLSKKLRKALHTALVVYIAGLLPSIALSLMNMTFADYVMPAALLAAGTLLYLLAPIKRIVVEISWRSLKPVAMWLAATVLFAFASRVLLQSASVVPELADKFLANRYFIIAFIHLCTIGILSSLLIFLLNDGFQSAVKVRVGIAMLLVGFLASELVMILEGSMVSIPATVVVFVTTLMPIGVLVLLTSKRKLEVSS